jgi:hypothetical protein
VYGFQRFGQFRLTQHLPEIPFDGVAQYRDRNVGNEVLEGIFVRRAGSFHDDENPCHENRNGDHEPRKADCRLRLEKAQQTEGQPRSEQPDEQPGKKIVLQGSGVFLIRSQPPW